eukprot:TRINITY_DN26414_c1_g1_i1.p1 TRINITY_DN26414_c1_g1~~TRINITY_DN26414_c1_g1_i1.p1  ORF type:complete len:427 (-),score=110.32 TRINITY_DN26414_c1_g1_i1:198-1478(-)
MNPFFSGEPPLKQARIGQTSTDLIQMQPSKPAKAPQCPGFISKIYDMCQSSQFSDFVGWNAAGNALEIRNVNHFSELVLPTFFKHKNFASFARQLNMYGFKKMSNDPNLRIFGNPNFLRNRPDILHLIKRKSPGETKCKNDKKLWEGRGNLDVILDEMARMKARQDNMEKQYSSVATECNDLRSQNAALWQQLSTSRDLQSQLHGKVQNVICFLYELYSRSVCAKMKKDKSKCKLLMDKGPSMPQDFSEETKAQLTKDKFFNDGALPPSDFSSVVGYLNLDPPFSLPHSAPVYSSPYISPVTSDIPSSIPSMSLGSPAHSLVSSPVSSFASEGTPGEDSFGMSPSSFIFDPVSANDLNKNSADLINRVDDLEHLFGIDFEKKELESSKPLHPDEENIIMNPMPLSTPRTLPTANDPVGPLPPPSAY